MKFCMGMIFFVGTERLDKNVFFEIFIMDFGPKYAGDMLKIQIQIEKTMIKTVVLGILSYGAMVLYRFFVLT